MTAGGRVAAFRAEASGLVDELLAALKPADRDALELRLTAGDSVLRLAINLVPEFSVALYVAIHDTDPPRTVLIASYPEPPQGASSAPDLLN